MLRLVTVYLVLICLRYLLDFAVFENLVGQVDQLFAAELPIVLFFLCCSHPLRVLADLPGEQVVEHSVED